MVSMGRGLPRALMMGLLAGSAASVGLYGIACLAFVANTPGLTNRGEVAGRSLFFCLLSCVLVWKAWRRLPVGFLPKGLASLVTILCVVGLWLGWAAPLWWSDPQNRWRELEHVAKALQAQVGSERWSLPKGWSYAVISGPGAGGDLHLEIRVSDRWLAYAFGVDLFNGFDFIRVVVGRDGRLRRARVDYF